MSQACATLKCERISRGVCDCCKQNLCLQHLTEHNALLFSQLNPLTDDINALGDRLKTINIQDVVSGSRKKLEQWRRDCYEKINRFFEQKCQELDRLVVDKLDKQRENILQIQMKVAKLVREQEVTRQDIDLLTADIRQLENEINETEQASLKISTRPIVVDDSLVQIKLTNVHQLDLSTLPPVYRTLKNTGGSYAALASNDRLLLIHRKPNLRFVDTELTIVKQVLWSYGQIYDMCWSSSLNRFIVTEQNNLFLVDEETMSIESVKTVPTGKWHSCTCSDTFLFLSTRVWGSSVLKLSLLPSIVLVQEWKSPNTCPKDEVIDDIAYYNETLLFSIINKIENSVRIELRSSETLDRSWSHRLDVAYNENIRYCCFPLACNEWIMVDVEAKRLLHITKDGKMKTTVPYNPAPYRVCLFNPDTLVVSIEVGINCHKI
jgi:hypothetical protein